MNCAINTDFLSLRFAFGSPLKPSPLDRIRTYHNFMAEMGESGADQVAQQLDHIHIDARART